MACTVHGILQARILELGSFSLLQGIFSTQGSNPSLPHCRWILYQLSHQGSDVEESAVRETQVRSLGQEDPLEKEMANHSSVLAWKIPWTEEPGRLRSMGSQWDHIHLNGNVP